MHICRGNTEDRLAFVRSLYPKLFIRHFLGSSVNRDACLFASNVTAEFVGLITGHYVIFDLRRRKRSAMEKQLYTRKFKMKLACHKKMCLKFPFVHIIVFFCWCFFRGNYTFFVLYKIDIFSVHIFIKI